MDTSDLPVWAQQLFLIGTAIAAMATGVIGYFKSRVRSDQKPAGEATVVAATFADSQAIETLTQQLHLLDQSVRAIQLDMRQHAQDRRQENESLRQAATLLASSITNLLAFIRAR